jgi:hypothetical protein
LAVILLRDLELLLRRIYQVIADQTL